MYKRQAESSSHILLTDGFSAAAADDDDADEEDEKCSLGERSEEEDWRMYEDCLLDVYGESSLTDNDRVDLTAASSSAADGVDMSTCSTSMTST